MATIFPLSVRRLRFVFAGGLCLWLMLGLLHSSSQLFQLDEQEFQDRNGVPALQHQLDVKYRKRSSSSARKGRTYFQSRNLSANHNSNGVLVVGNLSALPRNNLSQIVLSKPKKPKQAKKRRGKKKEEEQLVAIWARISGDGLAETGLCHGLSQSRHEQYFQFLSTSRLPIPALVLL